jgi:hypothetical protein
MGRAKGMKARKPKVAEMPFAWTDALINEVQESTNSASALLDKYASDPPSPGKSQRERRWAPPTAAARKNRKPRTAAEKRLAAERATNPLAVEASADALSWRLDEWFNTPIGKRVAASTPQLPLGPYIDEVLNEPIQKRFSRFDQTRIANLRAIEENNAKIAEWHASNEEEGAECPIQEIEALGYEENAVALINDEVSCASWVSCTVIGGFTGSKTYTCVFEDKTETRDSCQVAFPAWSDASETLAALTSALRRRRDAESLLAFSHTISNIPVNDISVTLPVRASWERLLRIGLSRAPFDSDVVRSEALAQLESQYNFGQGAMALPPPPPTASDITAEDARLASATTSLCGEVCALYHAAMNRVIFDSDSLNPYHLQAYLARDLPLPPPFQGPPVCGVAANPRDEVQPNKATFRQKTFLECPEVVSALATALNAAQDVKATRLLTTTHQFPRTPSTFTEDQDKHIKDTVRSRRPVDATRVHLTMTWVVLFSIWGLFGPRRGRRGVSERPRSRRWRLRDRAAAMASARRHATATPSTRPHESLRTASSDRDAPRRSAN